MSEPEKIKSLLLELLNSPVCPFPSKGKLNITCEKGVYIIYDPTSVVAHVGNTPRGKNGLCQRINNHISGNSSFARDYLQPNNLSVRNGFTYRILELPSARERALVEALACGTLCPMHMGTGETRE